MSETSFEVQIIDECRTDYLKRPLEDRYYPVRKGKVQSWRGLYEEALQQRCKTSEKGLKELKKAHISAPFLLQYMDLVFRTLFHLCLPSCENGIFSQKVTVENNTHRINKQQQLQPKRLALDTQLRARPFSSIPPPSYPPPPFY